MAVFQSEQAVFLHKLFFCRFTQKKERPKERSSYKCNNKNYSALPSLPSTLMILCM